MKCPPPKAVPDVDAAMEIISHLGTNNVKLRVAIQNVIDYGSCWCEPGDLEHAGMCPICHAAEVLAETEGGA